MLSAKHTVTFKFTVGLLGLSRNNTYSILSLITNSVVNV